jgi:hypothetical protein
VCLALLTGGLMAAVSAAQESDPRAEAKTLFDEASALARKGRCVDAIPKLERSLNLDPASGTAYNLAVCEETVGRTATASRYYQRAAQLAGSEGNLERRASALSEDARVAAEVAHLIVDVPPSHRVADLRVSCDGVDVSWQSWGAAVPIDPGDHTIEARASGRVAWTAQVKVERSRSATVAVPLLEPQPNETGKPVADLANDNDTDTGHATSSRLAAFIVGGAGIAAVVVGAGLGIGGLVKNGESEDKCPDPGDGEQCVDKSTEYQDALDLKDGARALGTAGLTTLVLGGAAVATGVILFATSAGDEGTTARRITLIGTPAGLLLSGAFE